MLKMGMLQEEEETLKLQLELKLGSFVCKFEDETHGLAEKVPSLGVGAFEVVPWLVVFLGWVGLGRIK